METKIKWNEGEGYITATYEGSGNGSASIASDINEGIDRIQTITVETTQGSEPKSEAVQVTQIGLREVFEPNDGMFVLKDGGTFNVLKVGGVEPDKPQIPTEPIEGVTIATSEGYFIPYAEWDSQGTAVVGVCVKTDEFAIIMGLTVAQKRWSPSASNVSGIPNSSNYNNLESYMDGQAYTDIMYELSTSTNYAAAYARSQKITIGEKEYVGYVGSTGEWSKIMEYNNDILAAFSAIGYSFSGSTSSRNMLTSCQYSNSMAWRFAFTSSGFGSFGSIGKTTNGYLKVLFKYE